MLKMAIMGAGSIANKMADTITKMNDKGICHCSQRYRKSSSIC